MERDEGRGKIKRADRGAKEEKGIRPHRLRWLGHCPLTAEKGDRRPLGLPNEDYTTLVERRGLICLSGWVRFPGSLPDYLYLEVRYATSDGNSATFDRFNGNDHC